MLIMSSFSSLSPPSPLLLRSTLFPPDQDVTLLLGGDRTGKTSLSFALCHELARDLGDSSIFVCHQNHFQKDFPLPVAMEAHTPITDSGFGSSTADVGTLFSPGALRKIVLLHPDTTSTGNGGGDGASITALLIEASLCCPPPRCVVLDGLSSLIDPQGSPDNLSSPHFLKQARHVLAHLLDLLSSPTGAAGARGWATAHLPAPAVCRVVVTEGRLMEGAAGRRSHPAYFALLSRFFHRVVQLQQSQDQDQGLPSSVSIHVSRPLSTLTASATNSNSNTNTTAITNTAGPAATATPAAGTELFQWGSSSHYHSSSPAASLLVVLGEQRAFR